MKTFSEQLTDFQTLSRDDSTNNQALGISLLNSFTRRVLMMRDWTFNRGSQTILSNKGDWVYPLPNNCERVIGVKVRSGDTVYWPKEVINRDDWEQLATTRSAVSSDTIQRYFIDGGLLEVYPTFSTSNNDITTYYQKSTYSMNFRSAYAAGTIARSAGSRSVIGTSTAFTDDMIDMYIQFEDEPYWEKITKWYSTTSIATERASRTARDDDSYTISQMIPLPYGYEDVPLHWALEVYFESKENPAQAKMWREMRMEGLNELLRRDAKSTGNIIEKSDTVNTIIDVNKYPEI